MIDDEQLLRKKNNRYLTIRRWRNYHNWPSRGQLNHFIFNRKKNGFEDVIKKIGNRWLIDEVKFFEWLSNNKF